MFELSPTQLKLIIAHWDKKEELCQSCEQLWVKLSTAQRREHHRTYELEKPVEDQDPKWL